MCYCHLTLEERREIYILREKNLGIRAIARALNRSASTVSREINRNVDANNDGAPQYNYLQANERYHRKLHNQKGGKLQNTALKEYISSRLLQKWSPEQISGRIELDYAESPDMRISFSTIYRWIHLHYLEAITKSNLRRHGRRPQPKIKRFPDANLVKNRGPEASNRQRIGDWEMDTIASAKRDISGLSTMCNRKSRYCILDITRNSKSQYNVKQIIKNVSKKFPCFTITADQGAEFSCYKDVQDEMSIQFYVCNPHSPWQKGSVENMNGLIREFFPRGTNFREISVDEIQNVMELLNNRPRKCLAWRTPSEILLENL